MSRLALGVFGLLGTALCLLLGISSWALRGWGDGTPQAAPILILGVFLGVSWACATSAYFTFRPLQTARQAKMGSIAQVAPALVVLVAPLAWLDSQDSQSPAKLLPLLLICGLMSLGPIGWLGLLRRHGFPLFPSSSPKQ